MVQLALLAMLALVLLPTVGRIAQQSSAGAATRDNTLDPALGAICTARGLVYDPEVAVIEARGFVFQTDADDRRIPPPHTGDDCDYCTIAATSLSSGFVSLGTATPTSDIALPSLRNHVVIWHYPLGLGSRGPPLTA
jgi:hypothetical protein